MIIQIMHTVLSFNKNIFISKNITDNFSLVVVVIVVVVVILIIVAIVVVIVIIVIAMTL